MDLSRFLVFLRKKYKGTNLVLNHVILIGFVLLSFSVLTFGQILSFITEQQASLMTFSWAAEAMLGGVIHYRY